jgi:hypothetical protein
MRYAIFAFAAGACFAATNAPAQAPACNYTTPNGVVAGGAPVEPTR